MRRPLFSRLTWHIPPGQFGRYLVVGSCNTTFAYGTYVLFTALLNQYMLASYMAGALISSVLNITVSFLGYKWFVFKTSGNYLKEWGRCLAVYSGTIVLGLALLPPTVFLISYITENPTVAPYIAGTLILGVQVVLNFVGHKKFSFGPPSGMAEADRSFRQ